MRLFVGLKPSAQFRAALSVMQESLRAAGVTARYDEPSNFHMTLAFIGEWPENIAGMLPPVDHPFSLVLSHAGIFPEARVIWAGVKPSEALDQLARRVRMNLQEAGVPFDPKPFVPHITLARKPVVPEELDLSGIEIPSAFMTVSDVYLYRSDRTDNGMVYSVIGSSAASVRETGPGPV